MSIVKDFLLVSAFLILAIKYLFLYKNMIKERNFFINTLSHDLRVTTIAQIRGIEILEKHKNIAAEPQNLIRDIKNSCMTSLELTNTLIKNYKYKNKEQVLKYEYFNFLNIINENIKNLEPLVLEKKLQIDFSTNCYDPIYADKTELFKFFQLFLPIIICNTNKNTIIKILFNKQSKNFNFIIKYQGISLEKKDFIDLYDNNTYFSTVGHGIKMHLCKKIIDFHNGRIKFTKNGNKNTFTISIPVNRLNLLLKSAFSTSVLRDNYT